MTILSNALSRSQGVSLYQCVVGDARGRRIALGGNRETARAAQIEIVERFEVNPRKPELVRFLNEHAGE